jgi:Protein of unknwon function (DUF3008)
MARDIDTGRHRLQGEARGDRRTDDVARRGESQKTRLELLGRDPGSSRVWNRGRLTGVVLVIHETEAEKVSDLKGPAKSMYESMSESQLEDFASTKRKGKPEHAAKKN